MNALRAANDRLKSWLIDQALPFWATIGKDETGGVFETLDLQGTPHRDQIRRMRVAARQAYVYAHAYHLGWYNDGKAMSDHCFEYVTRFAAITGTNGTIDTKSIKGFAHRLGPDHKIADASLDTYDHAFVLLACAWREKAFAASPNRVDDSAALATSLGFLARIKQPDGSYLEGEPARLPRRQNPHMHLFEAFLTLHTVTRDARYKAQADAIFALFTEHFWDQDNQVIREYFTHDWSLDKAKCNRIDPGHMIEWCWLLDMYEVQSGIDASEHIASLYDQARFLGEDRASGFLRDEFDLNTDSKITRRTWTQTEFIKANLVRARRVGKLFPAIAADLIHKLCDTYLNTSIAGTYTDQFDGEGNIISTTITASTLYHLMSASAEAEKTVTALGL